MPATERLFLTQDQERYLEWLLTPEIARVPASKEAWARENDCTTSTLRNWEAKKHFRERWKLGIEGMNQSPERTQRLLDSLYSRGLEGDTRSAELYLKATGNLNTSTTVNVKNETAVREVSDEDLEKMILELGRKHATVVPLKGAAS